MLRDKPYLSFSQRLPGTASLLFKKAAEKNSEIQRTKTVEEHRQEQELLAAVRLTPPGIVTQLVDCAGVPCEWIHLPDSPPDKVILYLHGGSWAFGNLKTAKAAGVLLAEATGYRVLVAEYRLSPQHPYPAGLEDVLAVYRWLLEQDFSPDKIGLFGDSAGGNLCLCLLGLLRQQALPMPRAVALASPVTDLTPQSELLQQMPNLCYTVYQGEEWDIFTLYCADHDRSSPLISPLFADMQGYPPMLIHAGADEELAIDNTAFAQRAYEQGVEVELKIWKEMFHDFTIVGVTLKESRQSMREIGQFFVQRL